MQKGQIIRPFGPIIYRNQISESMQAEVLDKAAVSSEDATSALAGNIEKEVFIDLSTESADELAGFIFDFMAHSAQVGMGKKDAKVKRLSFERVWVNSQRKGEWNPPHSHSATFSLVAYCQIPEALKEEWKHANQQGQDPTGGMIQWNYGQWAPYNKSTFGPVTPQERDIYVFPSWLQHQVFPFNADVTRISLSTNCVPVFEGM